MIPRIVKMTAIPLAIVILFSMFFLAHQTNSTEVGVRIIKWSPFVHKGVSDTLYPPGAVYFFPPFINDWYVFDTKLQNMEMTAENRGARQGKDDLVFKTIDGNDLSLDVIIAYRLDPKKIPLLLTLAGRNNHDIEEKLVRPISRNVTRELFGELKTEDFYVAEKRQLAAETAQKVLNEILNPSGVIVESVLPRDYRFNSAYQKAIEEKKVADQMAERFKSETKATVEEYLQKLQEANGANNKMIADIDGEYSKAKIATDAYYEQQTLIAKAIEAEGIAQAKGIEKMVEALNSSGGKTMIKLKLAEALQGKHIYLLPIGGSGIDLKTTNINDLLQLYGIQHLGNKQ